MPLALLPSSARSKNSTTVRSGSGDPATRQRMAKAAVQLAFALSDDLGGRAATYLFTTPHRHHQPERERVVLEGARPFTVEVQREAPRWRGQPIRVAAWRWGHGPAALLVHGWEGRGGQLGALVAPLLAAGLSVVTFDAPGHGGSGGDRLYLTDHADAIVAVAQATTDVHAVIAHSFGAPAALLARARAGLDAARTVFVAPNALVDRAVGHFCQAMALDPAARAAFVAAVERDAGLPLGALTLDALVGAREGAALVIHDADDREIPLEQGERLAQAWPGGAELMVTHGLGHRRILRDPAVITRIVEFAGHGVAPPRSELVRRLDAGQAGGSRAEADADR